MSDSSYRSYLVRIRDRTPDGPMRAEIEQVRSGIRVVVEGELAERLVGAVEESLVQVPPSPPTKAKEISWMLTAFFIASSVHRRVF